MKQYTVAAAKDRLSGVLHEVEAAGEPIAITRHGRPVAVLLSMAEYERIRGARPDLWVAYELWRQRSSDLTDEDVERLADPTRAQPPAHGVDW